MKNKINIFAVSLFALFGCGEDEVVVDVPVEPTIAHVDGADFVEEAQLFVHSCEMNGVGQGVVGDQIADFSYVNCYGETVQLHSYCGKRAAMWIVGSAGWCGACISHMPEVARVLEQRRHEGLEAFIFVGETEQRTAVTQEWCMGFANAHGVDPATMIYDPNAADGLQGLWQKIRPNGGGGGTIGLPWEVILDPYDMTFYWDSNTSGDLMVAIDELLAQ
jgi:hypothetical protein